MPEGPVRIHDSDEVPCPSYKRSMEEHVPSTIQITRIACCAPGCGRGIGVDAWRRRFGDLDIETAQYVCQKHWSAVPERMRRVYAQARRRERRFGTHLPGTARLWRRIVRDITGENGVGHPMED